MGREERDRAGIDLCLDKARFGLAGCSYEIGTGFQSLSVGRIFGPNVVRMKQACR